MFGCEEISVSSLPVSSLLSQTSCPSGIDKIGVVQYTAGDFYGKLEMSLYTKQIRNIIIFCFWSHPFNLCRAYDLALLIVDVPRLLFDFAIPVTIFGLCNVKCGPSCIDNSIVTANDGFGSNILIRKAAIIVWFKNFCAGQKQETVTDFVDFKC